jgi:hypothetical protein
VSPAAGVLRLPLVALPDSSSMRLAGYAAVCAWELCRGFNCLLTARPSCCTGMRLCSSCLALLLRGGTAARHSLVIEISIRTDKAVSSR